MASFNNYFVLVYCFIMLIALRIGGHAQTSDCDCNQCQLRQGRNVPAICPTLNETVTYFSRQNIQSPICRNLPNCTINFENSISCQDIWTCCKQNATTISCRARANKLTDYGYCPPADATQNCYRVLCECEFSPAPSTTPAPSASPAPSTTPAPSASPATSTSHHQSHHQKSTSVAIGVGVGLGLGIAVLLAGTIGLMFYCRKQGEKKGRNTTQPVNNNIAFIRSEDGLDDYAEIGENTYAGDRTIRGAANPGYDIVKGAPNVDYQGLNKPDTPAIQSHYKSLKKPNDDFESADYMDPEKYTEPPVLPKRNDSEIKDKEEDDDDEDYVSQGSEKPPAGGDDRDYFTLEPLKPSGDNVSQGSGEPTADDEDKDYFTLEPPKPSSDYLNVDTLEPLKPSGDNVSQGSGEPTAGDEDKDYFTLEPPKPSSDYLNVDLQASDNPDDTKDYFTLQPLAQSGNGNQDLESPKQQSSDYVDVDDPSLLKTESKSKPSSDYVDVDDPSLSKKESDIDPSSDYVQV